MKNTVYVESINGYLSFDTDEPASTSQLTSVVNHAVDKEDTYLVDNDLLVTFSVQDPNLPTEVKVQKMSGVKTEVLEKEL